MVLEILLHHLDPAHLDSGYLTQFLEHFVVNEDLAQLNNANMGILGFPNLTFG